MDHHVRTPSPSPGPDPDPDPNDPKPNPNPDPNPDPNPEPTPNQVCKPCTPGHYCEEGAPVATACAAGSYSNASDLGSQADCTVTAAGS